MLDKTPLMMRLLATIIHARYRLRYAASLNYSEGCFLKALSRAYKNIIEAHDSNGKRLEGVQIENVALVIGEINRGNATAIFGTLFELFDRNKEGWSSYDVSIDRMTFTKLLELCNLKSYAFNEDVTYKLGSEIIHADQLQERLKFLNCNFETQSIKLPPNLSIIASMNTSNTSIYHMDEAFKRRWEWEYIDIDNAPGNVSDVKMNRDVFLSRSEWNNFRIKLNMFIRDQSAFVIEIEDKQIGHWFIVDEVIKMSSIKNKLMFFIWDSVFGQSKKPLNILLNKKLLTFGDFCNLSEEFIKSILEYQVK